MKTTLPIIILTFFGCSNLQTPPVKDVESATPPPYTLEYLLENNFTATDILPSQYVHLKSVKELKESFLTSKKKTTGKVNSNLFNKSIKTKNYAAIKNYDPGTIVRSLSKLPPKQFGDFAKDLSNQDICEMPNLAYATASMLEKSLPSQDILTSIQNLLQKTASCSGTDDLKTRANFRLAIFSLLNNDCAAALEFLTPVQQTQHKNFAARADYWKRKCDKSITRTPALAESTTPFSYHSILTSKMTDTELTDIINSRSITPILFRTEKNDKINDLILAFEKQYITNPSTARNILGFLKDDSMNDLEPEFLVYIGYLANLAEDDLTAFQALSKAFAKKSDLKTKSTAKLYFPLRYLDQSKRYAEAEGLDYRLVLALIRQESAFNSNAVSRVGARGLMQIMPRTARIIDRNINSRVLFNADKNIYAGTKYLAQLIKRYDNNLVRALAAYNAGHGNVDKWIQRYPTEDDLLFMDTIPFQETREYVSSILRNYYWYQNLTPDLVHNNPVIGMRQFN